LWGGVEYGTITIALGLRQDRSLGSKANKKRDDTVCQLRSIFSSHNDYRLCAGVKESCPALAFCSSSADQRWRLPCVRSIQRRRRQIKERYVHLPSITAVPSPITAPSVAIKLSRPGAYGHPAAMRPCTCMSSQEELVAESLWPHRWRWERLKECNNRPRRSLLQIAS
jgi:hypothetical protein